MKELIESEINEMSRYDKEDHTFGPIKDQDEDIVEEEESKEFDILSEVSLTFSEEEVKQKDLMGYKGIEGESYLVSAVVSFMYSKAFDDIDAYDKQNKEGVD